MSSNSVFSYEMLSLDTIENWTLFNILKQAKASGYTGAPSEPIAAYRRALLSTMSHNQPDENERICALYLKAEKAYIALDSELAVLEYVQDHQNGTAAESASASPAQIGGITPPVSPGGNTPPDSAPPSENDSPIAFAGSSDDEDSCSSPVTLADSSDAEHEEVESDGEVVSALIAMDDDSDSDVPSTARHRPGSKAAKASTPVSAASTKQNGKSKPTPGGRTSAPASVASRQSDRASTKSSDRNPVAVSKTPKNSAAKSSEKLAPAATAPKSAKQNGKSKSSERNTTPLSATQRSEKSNPPRTSRKTKTPASAPAKQKVSKTQRTPSYAIPSSSKASSSRESNAQTPETPPKRIMKHPVPWTSPGHAYIAPPYKPSGRSDPIKGFISYSNAVRGAKRKREIVGEPIAKPVQYAESVVPPTPYHLNLDDGPERAVKKGRRVKVPEPEPEPLRMAKPGKPVRYKYEFMPKPGYKFRETDVEIPYKHTRARA